MDSIFLARVVGLFGVLSTLAVLVRYKESLAMILNIAPRPVLWAEVIVMGFSGVGVAIKVAKREQFQCACLGTFLKVPLTRVTLIEDFGMAALAALMLVLVPV